MIRRMAEASQTVFGPHRPHLFVGRKLATGGGGFRAGDSGLLFGRERHRRFIIRAGEPKNDMSDVVLRVRGKTACGFECLIEKFSHHARPIFPLLLFVCWRGKASAFAGRCRRWPRGSADRFEWCEGKIAQVVVAPAPGLTV